MHASQQDAGHGMISAYSWNIMCADDSAPAHLTNMTVCAGSASQQLMCALQLLHRAGLSQDVGLAMTEMLQVSCLCFRGT